MRKRIVDIGVPMFIALVLVPILGRTGALPSRSIPVLLYHHLAPASEGRHLSNGAIVPVEEFRQQMELLKKSGYRTMTVSELGWFLSLGLEIPPRTVVITFDDGYESVETHAAPILRELGLRATVFIIGDRVGRKGPELGHLSWEDMKALSESGVLEFQHHTFAAHHLVDGQRPALTTWRKEEIVKDLEGLDETFVEHGLPRSVGIAYPYGACSDVTLQAVREAGLKMGFTVERGRVFADSNRFRLPRIIVFPGTSIEQFAALLGE